LSQGKCLSDAPPPPPPLPFPLAFFRLGGAIVSSLRLSNSTTTTTTTAAGYLLPFRPLLGLSPTTTPTATTATTTTHSSKATTRRRRPQNSLGRELDLVERHETNQLAGTETMSSRMSADLIEHHATLDNSHLPGSRDRSSSPRSRRCSRPSGSRHGRRQQNGPILGGISN